jgi:hypothetical protein
MRQVVLIAGLAILGACGNHPSNPAGENYRKITLPGGQTVNAEVLIRPQDILRGMMLRNALAPDRGMLFVHVKPGKYAYWMYNVRVPLDIIWMDKNRRIVEISANTPPCPESDGNKCPRYGGKKESMFVLEIAGGMAEKYGLSLGQVLDF